MNAKGGSAFHVRRQRQKEGILINPSQSNWPALTLLGQKRSECNPCLVVERENASLVCDEEPVPSVRRRCVDPDLVVVWYTPLPNERCVVHFKLENGVTAQSEVSSVQNSDRVFN